LYITTGYPVTVPVTLIGMIGKLY